MRNLFSLFMLLALTLSCKNHKEKDPAPNTRSSELKIHYDAALAAALAKAGPDGWINYDCDGMLWTGKFACGGGSPNFAAAEYESSGRMNRRPPPFCGPEDDSSKTTWSRDMGMGLISGAWCTQNLEVLKRHASYGISKNWEMGSPLADGRAIYTPSIIGILYQTIHAMGGEDSPNRAWPSVYSPGLNDFEAHLQMIDIWLRGGIGEATHTPVGLPRRETIDLSLIDISNAMYERIKEHSDREAECPFYQYLRGLYDYGNLDRTIELLLSSDKPNCTYVRGDDSETAEWLFVAKQTLTRMGY